MNRFISKKDKGLEVGAGAGFSKIFTKNKIDLKNLLEV